MSSRYNGIGVSVSVGVNEGVIVGEGVGVNVGLSVGVIDGVIVGEGVGVNVGVSISVIEGVIVRVGGGVMVGGSVNSSVVTGLSGLPLDARYPITRTTVKITPPMAGMIQPPV